MNKKILIRILISIIIGIILGIITELILIYDYRNDIALITQSIGFWVIVILLGVLFSNNIKKSILTNVLIMDFMTITYYVIRFLYNGNLNIYSMKNLLIEGTIGAILISTILQLPKKGTYISIISYIYIIVYFINYYILRRFNQGAWLATTKINYNIYIFLAFVGIIICVISIILKINEIIKYNKLKTKNI